MESEELSGAVEAKLCDTCNKFHVGDKCGLDIVDGDNFIVEFEKLPPDEHIQKLRKTIQQLRDDRWAATAKAELYKRKLQKLSKDLPNVKEEVSRQKFSVKRLKTLAAQNHALLQSEFHAISGVIQDAIDKLGESLTCDGSCVHMREQFKGLQADHEALRAVEKELLSRVVTLEAELAAKIKEADALTLHAKNRDLNTDQKLSKLQKELAQKDNELKTLKRDHLISQRRLEEESEKFSQSQVKASKYLSECDRMKSLLKHAQDESQRLMAEREMETAELERLKMDLEENNKEMAKMRAVEEEEEERASVKDDVDKEMMKMMKGMDEYQALIEKRVQELKADLRRVRKLRQASEKDKEKMRKEFEQYVMEYRANESKLMGKMKASESKHKETISQLYRDLEEAKSSAAAREHDLQIQIKQLHNHLGNMTDRSASSANTPVPDGLRDKDTHIRTLTNQVQFYKDKMRALERTLEKQQRPDSLVDEKVEMLETLVQKEVEERKQLMESFTKAREELQRLKQPYPGYAEERKPQDDVFLEYLSEGHKGEQTKPKNASSLESLAIYKKRTENKYSGFRPSESSAMDISELQNGTAYPRSGYGSEHRSTYGTNDHKSVYGASEYRSTNGLSEYQKSSNGEYGSEFPKSAKTDVTRVTAKTRYTEKSAKSVKSLKSIKSHYALENEDGAFKLQKQDNGRADLQSNDITDDAAGEADTDRSTQFPTRPTPPQFRARAPEPASQMPYLSSLEKYSKNANRKEMQIKPRRYESVSDRQNGPPVKETEIVDALGRIASGSNPDRVPVWATRQRKKNPLASRAEGEPDPDVPTPPWRKQRMSWAPEIETIVSKGDTPSLYHPSLDKARGLPKGRVGHSDGFLESHRASPVKNTEMPRMSMMMSLNQGKGKLTSDSSWKIYQQLKVGKQ